MKPITITFEFAQAIVNILADMPFRTVHQVLPPLMQAMDAAKKESGALEMPLPSEPEKKTA